MDIIFNFLSGLLNSIFNFTGDWGLAIVLLTVCVRITLLPISFKQKKSMQQQQKLSIKMQAIKEKYKDNKDKLDYVTFFKIEGQAKISKGNITIMALIGLFIAKTAPIALGIYLIATGVFSFLEELAFRIYMRNLKTV